MTIVPAKIECDLCHKVYEYEAVQDTAADGRLVEIVDYMPDGTFVGSQWLCDECILCGCGSFCTKDDCNCDDTCLHTQPSRARVAGTQP